MCVPAVLTPIFSTGPADYQVGVVSRPADQSLLEDEVEAADDFFVAADTTIQGEPLRK